jgi:hypothetical protein
MSDEFFRTRMGHRFFEATMPKIADQLDRLNTNLEALVAELREHRRKERPAEPAAEGAEVDGDRRG